MGLDVSSDRKVVYIHTLDARDPSNSAVTCRKVSYGG
ncbi:hypothetical protein [Bellilinea sp.]